MSESPVTEPVAAPGSRRVSGILLAAGRGERFGSDKLLAPLLHTLDDIPAGTPLAVASCRHLVAGLPDTIAVIRPGAVELESRLRELGARIVTCADADRGMSATLACGVSAAPDAQGWVIALADMPWVRVDTIRRVAQAITEGARVAAPYHSRTRGHPVGFGKDLREALLALTGDQGARDIVRQHQRTLVRVVVDDPGVLRDVDTPSDL